MSGIAPTNLRTNEMRFFLRLVWGVAPTTPVGDVIRKFEAHRASQNTAGSGAGARVAALSGDKPTGRHADDDDDDDNDNGDDAADDELALGAPASKRKPKSDDIPEYLNCSICGVDYLTRQPGQHFATFKHCIKLRSAGKFCSLLCRFRSPAPRVDTPPAADADVLAPTAPHAINRKSGVTVCRGCGGLRTMTVELPGKIGRRPRGRPRKVPRVEQPPAEGAAAAAAAPQEGQANAATPAVVDAVAPVVVAEAVAQQPPTSATPAAVAPPPPPTTSAASAQPTSSFVTKNHKGRVVTVGPDPFAQPSSNGTTTTTTDATRRRKVPTKKPAKAAPAKRAREEADDDYDEGEEEEDEEDDDDASEAANPSENSIGSLNADDEDDATERVSDEVEI